MSSIGESYESMILAFMESDAENLRLEQINTGKQRARIYEFLEKHDLCGQSYFYEGSTNKYIVVSKYKQVEKTPTTFTWTPEMISILATYASLPIPIYLPQYIDYYLDHLEKYYNAKHMASKFMDAIAVYPLPEFKRLMQKIKSDVNEYIKHHPEFIEFNKKTHDTSDSQKIIMKHDVYHEMNERKTLISIDIKSAYFRVLKHYCPGLFTDEWKTFLQGYTDITFLLESKMFREIIFGDLNCKKIHGLQNVLINDVHQVLLSSEFESLIKPIYCLCDEIVYEIKDPSIFDYESFAKLVNSVHLNYFHIRMFKLVKLGSHPYFVKEYIKPNDIRNEFKCVPKKFIMQVIKFYESKPMIELDRKFADVSGYIATFDKSIFDQ